MQFSTVLLDWDGCMAKTLQVWMSTYQKVYSLRGIRATSAEIIEKSWGNLSHGPKNFGIEDNEECWREIIVEVRKGTAQVPLYPGVVETITTLKERKVKLAIVTSSEKSVLLPALKFNQLDELIDVVVTEEDVNHPKPHPEIVTYALEKLSSDVAESIIIGDTGKDIEAGKAAGIATILLCHQENSQFYDFAKYIALRPDFIATEFSDLERIVSGEYSSEMTTAE